MPIQIHLRGQPRQSAASFKRLFPGRDPQQVAKAAGAPDGASVEFTGHGGDELHVNISHPQLTATRVFHRDRDEHGNPVLAIRHIRQDTAPEIRGQGRQRFAEQLGHLRAVGVGRVTTHGAGDAAGAATGNDSGFYAWPRMGFDGHLSDEQFQSLSPDLQRRMDASGSRTFHNLFGNGGAEEWRAKGTETGHLHFNTDPNSQHQKRFNEYHAAKEREVTAGATRRPLPSRISTGSPGQANPAGGTSESPRVGAGAVAALGIENRLRRAGLKFSRRRKKPSHPLVAGLRIEAVLLTLSTDPAATATTRKLAATVLTSGDLDALEELHEELDDSEHDLADRYDWRAAIDGLDLDAEIEQELRSLVPAFPSRDVALGKLRARVEADSKSNPELIASLRRLSRR